MAGKQRRPQAPKPKTAGKAKSAARVGQKPRRTQGR